MIRGSLCPLTRTKKKIYKTVFNIIFQLHYLGLRCPNNMHVKFKNRQEMITFHMTYFSEPAGQFVLHASLE